MQIIVIVLMCSATKAVVINYCLRLTKMVHLYWYTLNIETRCSTYLDLIACYGEHLHLHTIIQICWLAFSAELLLTNRMLEP